MRFVVVEGVGVVVAELEADFALGRSSGVLPPPDDDAFAFVPDAAIFTMRVGDVCRAGVASRSPALSPPLPFSGRCARRCHR